MSVTYGFYNSVGSDRRYNAEDVSRIFDGLVNDGVYSSIGDHLTVSPGTGLNVSVAGGRAWFNHTWTYNDVPLVLAITAPDLILDRIDTVVLEVNATTRTNTIKVLPGTPASTPVAPTLTNNANVHQYPLADVSVPVGLIQVNEENIANRIGTSDCPFVTAVLQTVSVSDLLTQWNAQFGVWFQEMKDQLSTDAAGNLQNQIDEMNPIPVRMEGRLTLGSGTPITTADVIGAGTLYYTPYLGNRIAHYDGAKWVNKRFTEASLSLAGLNANKNYDIFYYWDQDHIVLDKCEWASDNVRNAIISKDDGVYVCIVNTEHYPYLGTIRTSGAGVTEDSFAKRFVWNLYNQTTRVMRYSNSSSHNYALTTPRQWNNDAAARCDFVMGLYTHPVFGNIRAGLVSDGTALAAVGYGLNAVNTMASGLGISTKATAQVSTGERAHLSTITTPGYHYIALTEARFTGGTGTYNEASLMVEIRG